MEKKKLLFIVGIVLIVILGIVAIILSRKNTPSQNIDDNGNAIFDDASVAGLKITNQAIIARDKASTFTANITNSTSKENKIDSLSLIITLDGETINAPALPEYTFKADETYPIVISFDKDISKATKIEYEVVKNGEVVK